MNEEQFHTVDSESLKQITVDDILAGHSLAPVRIDYSIPVPTHSQSLPHRSRDAWLQVEMGGLDVASLPVGDAGDRGRFGGC